VTYTADKEVQGVKINIKYLNENNEMVPIRGCPLTAGFIGGAPVKNNEMSGGQLNGYI